MSKAFTLEELAQITGCTLIGNPHHTVSYVNSLDSASSSEVSFLSNPRYKDLLKDTQAGAICVDPTASFIEGKNFLVADSPSALFQRIADLLLSVSISGFLNVHSSAVIHETVSYDPTVTIGPHVTIDQGAVIGKGTKIYAGAFIGADVIIGENCVIYPNAVVRERCVLHNKVILQPGAVIGSCGFGYHTDAAGKHKKIEQLGNVILEDDVEIGANTTIDRARFKSTIICQGTKIDNLVQIGHNVILGKHNIIVAQTGISGSAETGDYVIMGGQAGVIGHIKITDHVQIATRGGVSKSITKPGQYGGSPLQPFQEFNKHRVYLRNIHKYVDRIEELEQKLAELEKKLSNI